MPVSEADLLLVKRIREGDQGAWRDCIARYEGRLLAFVNSRLRNRTTSEDVVQETFIGFLVGLPNYDERTPLESFLFSIAAHKLTDVLRRLRRRPVLPLAPLGEADSAAAEPASPVRQASSMARSHERRELQRQVLEEALRQLTRQWLDRGEFERLMCIELLFVLGWSNKVAAEHLGISEQTVANHKFYAVNKLREWIEKSRVHSVDLHDLFP